MINSRNIDDLRIDVAAGLSPLVTCTVRDQEQQDVYYKAGTGTSSGTRPNARKRPRGASEGVVQ